MGLPIRVAAALAGAVLLSWLALVLYVWVRRPAKGTAQAALRLLPDAIRLLRRVAADPLVHRGVRLQLLLLFAYLASPIDLVPDFIPVIGYADDVVIVAAVLRSVVRRAGPDAVRRNWPGTRDGLVALWRLARLPGEP